MCNVNVNGLCSKLSLLANFISQSRIDIVGVTETHLTSVIATSFVSIQNYCLLRCDTEGTTSKHGVCVYIHKDVKTDQVSVLYKNALAFRIIHSNTYVGIVYRPPSYTAGENHELLIALQTWMTGKEIVLMGDFNLPGIAWQEDGAGHGINSTVMERSYLDMFDGLGLQQWVTEPTYPSSGNTLDLVFSTEPDCIANITVEAPLPVCDHCPVVFDYVVGLTVPETDSHSDLRILWHKGNYDRLNQILADVDWDFELAQRSANDSFDRLCDIVKELSEGLIPLKPRRPPQSKPPWRTTPPNALVRERRRAWQTYKVKRLEHGRRSPAALQAYGIFTDLNKQVRNFSTQSQARYEHSLIEKWKDNPKLLHAYIRSKKSVPTTVGPLRLNDHSVSSDPQLMSECLAQAFCSVYTRGEPVNQAPHQRHDDHLQDIQLTVGDVKTLLAATDGNSAMGPDGLHPLVLKNCAGALAKPIHAIYFRTLREGQLPEAWKHSVVIPIFKKGLRLDPLNYRPVSLTSVTCKKFERVLCDVIYDYLDSSSLLSSHQFGFRPGHSTAEQLLLAYEEVSAGVDEGRTVDMVLFDYSKAFDVVPHAVLIKKLSYLGIAGEVLSWISSFLSNRTMRVSVNNKLSSPNSVTSGVPQGSVLGPLLFLVYINFVASGLSCKYKIFADDLKIYACGKTHRDLSGLHELERQIQTDINTLSSTSKPWGLRLNPNKCVVLRFSRRQHASPRYVLDGKELPTPKSHTDLGVIVDDSLKFHDHISSVTRKVAGLGHSFLKSTVCRSREFMLFFLKTHMRPVLEYASCVWHTGYIEDARRLERFQRYWTKQISMLEHLAYSDRLRELGLYSVKGRLMRADLIQYWKIFHRKSCVPPEIMFPQPFTRVTRGHLYKIGVTHVNTDVRKRSFSKRCVNAWNRLPEHVVDAPDVSAFKRGLDDVIPDLLFDYV